MGLANGALDVGVAAGQSLTERIQNVENNLGNEVGGAPYAPTFHGHEEDDVEEWIRQFEAGYLASRKPQEIMEPDKQPML